MKFIDQRANSIISFSTLPKGEMFLFHGEPFLKIDPIETPTRHFNAVDLIDGDPWTFGDEETIEKVWNCELVIKG